VLFGSLQGPDGEADTARCPGQVPSPDVVVGLSGCYYEFDGKPVGWFDDMTGWGNKDAEIRLVDGDQDTTCGGWQTDKVATALRVAGYHIARWRQPLRTCLPRHAQRPMAGDRR